MIGDRDIARGGRVRGAQRFLVVDDAVELTLRLGTALDGAGLECLDPVLAFDEGEVVVRVLTIDGDRRVSTVEIASIARPLRFFEVAIGFFEVVFEVAIALFEVAIAAVASTGGRDDHDVRFGRLIDHKLELGEILRGCDIVARLGIDLERDPLQLGGLVEALYRIA